MSGDTLSVARVRAWFDRPLSAPLLFVGMILATIAWFLTVHLAGGIADGDSAQTLLPTVAIAHGQVSCAYPPVAGNAPTLTTPLLPLLAAPFIAFFHAGAGALTNSATLGTGCAGTTAAISNWLTQPGGEAALEWTVMVGWLVLLGGVVAVMRTTSRGRTLWEPLALLAVAVCPPVTESVTHLFHPEGYLSLGILLWGIAAFRREMWVVAGVGFGAAILAHQFALLLVVPLLILMTREQLRRVVTGALLAAATILGPIVALTSGRVLFSISGSGDTTNTAGVWLAGLFRHLGPSELLTVSRGTPILLTALLALYVRLRHRGLPVTTDVALALGAAGFFLRLIFEIYLFDYYFLAAAVALVLAEIAFGRMRWTLLAWMVMLFAIFDPFAWFPHLPVSAVPTWLVQLVPSATGLWLAVTQLLTSAAYAAVPQPAIVAPLPVAQLQPIAR